MFTSATVHKHDWGTNERRSCHREPLQWAVLVFFGDNWGKLIDVSEKGMCFQFAHAPSVGEAVHFTFEAMGCMPIPHDGKIFGDSIQATGRVVWAIEFERTAGVQFLELSPRSRDQIRYWMSSVPTRDVVLQDKEAHTAWNNQRSSEAVQEAPATFPAPETASPSAHLPSPSSAEISKSHLGNQDSDTEVLWEADQSFSPQRPDAVEPDPELPRARKSAFTHSPVSSTHDTELRVGHEPEPVFTPKCDPLPSEMEELWQPDAVAAAQKLAPLDFEAGMMEHQERQKRGQTLELKQRRARVGFAAVLAFLATVGAVAGIIRFISKFNGGGEVAGDASRLSAGQVDSGRAQERMAAENASPFLVEVLDANNRRSVLWFSNETHANTAGYAAQNSVLLTAPTSSRPEPHEEKAAAPAKHEWFHDFSLVPPHASGSGTNASAESSAALVAPTLPGELPASGDMPLKETLPSPAVPPAERTPPLGGDVQPARLIRATLPIYPQIARTNRTAGDVTLDALVDESGNVRDIRVISGPILLREAAKEAVQRWKYEPARLDGRPTAMHLTVTVKFKNSAGDQ
jgi:TonB family protein